MSDFDPSRYTIELTRRTLEEGEFYEAKVRGIPGICVYAEEASEAFEVAREGLCTLYEMAIEQGKEFPEPIEEAAREYTGRITLRLSRRLHERASLVAESEGVSLNALISEAVAERVFTKKQSAVSAARQMIYTVMKDYTDIIREDSVPRLVGQRSRTEYRLTGIEHGYEIYGV